MNQLFRDGEISAEERVWIEAAIKEARRALHNPALGEDDDPFWSDWGEGIIQLIQDINGIIAIAGLPPINWSDLAQSFREAWIETFGDIVGEVARALDTAEKFYEVLEALIELDLRRVDELLDGLLQRMLGDSFDLVAAAGDALHSIRSFLEGIFDAIKEGFDYGLTKITNWIEDIFGFSFGKHDPLVFDLDLNGVQLTSLTGSDVHFDLDADGFAERTGWVSSTDGILVRDLDGNGTIDSGAELFGDRSQDGFTALAAHDANGDGRIDFSDAVWSTLRIWRDANQDGVTQAGELSALADHGILSIELEASASRSSRAGNSILFKGSFTTLAGAQEIVAVGFATDRVNTRFDLPEGFAYHPDVHSLPNLRGYGQVPDLWVAMTLDPVLRQMVHDLVSDGTSFTSLQDVVGEYAILTGATTGGGYFYPHSYDMQAFDHMLARWTGVDDGAEERVQAENIAETFMNRQADHAFGNPYFYQAFEKFATELAVRFYAQLPLSSAVGALAEMVSALSATPANGSELTPAEVAALVEPAQAAFQSRPPVDPDLLPYSLLRYDFRTDTIAGDVGGFIDSELAALHFDPDDPWEGYADWYAARQALLGVVDPDGFHLQARHRAHTGNLALPILTGSYNSVTGTEANDTLFGDPVGTTIKADLLRGGGGNDLLKGGTGSDTYVFSDGSGADVVQDTSGTDEIAFQGALTSALVRYSFAGANRADLLISFAGRPETVTVTGYFTSAGAATIESITFPDGGPAASQRAIRDGVMASLATPGNDLISGFDLDQTLAGLDGNDTLNGGEGRDVLEGGPGDDLLNGGEGTDTYVYELGDGHDKITDYGIGGAVDSLVLGAGIRPDMLRWARSVTDSDDIVLTFAGYAGSIQLDEKAKSSDYGPNQLVFRSGEIWSESDILAAFVAAQATPADDSIHGTYAGDALTGGAGNDSIFGRDGTDTITGGLGDDLLDGGEGTDLFIYDLGDGNDRIVDFGEGGAIDTLALGEQITPELVRVGISAADADDMIITFAGHAGSILLDEKARSGDYGPNRITFTSAPAWSETQILQAFVAGQQTEADDVIRGTYAGDAVSGGSGHDTIYGKAGQDVIAGGLGDDAIDGGDDADTFLYALGDGNDTITDYGTGGALDTLLFAAGIEASMLLFGVSASDSDDIVISFAGHAGSVVLNEKAESDDYGPNRIAFADGSSLSEQQILAAFVAGQRTEGDDVIHGSYAADVINGGAGNDAIYGKAGGDRITGGLGDDIIEGGDQADSFVYNLGDGNDRIHDYGTGGAVDTLEFGEAITPDLLRFTTSAADIDDIIITFAGHGGSVTLDEKASSGDYGPNAIRFANGTVWNEGQLLAAYVAALASSGADTIQGTYLADTIKGQGGDDSLFGRGGNDRFEVAVGEGFDAIDGGSGSDVIAAAGDAVAIGLRSLTSVETITADGFSDVIVQGSAAADTLNFANVALSGIVRLDGGGGDDVLTGNSADNALWGGDGDDTLNGGAGFDTLVGGAGADIMAGGTENDTYNVDNAGDTVVELAGGGSDRAFVSVNSYTLGAEVENMQFTGVGNFAGTGNASNNQIIGGAGGDTLSGGAGFDILDGRGGADTMAGGAHNDTYYVDNAGDLVVEEAGGGSDRVYTTLAAYTLSAEVENLTYNAAGSFVGTGNSLANQIIGGVLADILRGEGGNDTLLGNGGDDVLEGGTGADSLTGGAGNDVYRYISVSDSTAVARDTISFAAGDKIDLSLIDAIAGAGNDAFTFVGSSAFSGTAGELRAAGSGGSWTIEADIDGDGLADLVIGVITAGSAVGASDFVL